MKEFKNFKPSNSKKILFVLPVDEIVQLELNECLYALAEQESTVDLLVLAKGLDSDHKDALGSILKKPSVERPKGKPQQNQPMEFEMVSPNGEINYTIEDTQSDTFGKLFNEAFNYAVVNGYEWFTVVESDDVVAKNYLRYFNTYEKEKKEFDGFLPLLKESAPMGFAGFLNEACWVEGFAEVAGTFDLNLLLRFNCMNATGCAFKVESVKKYSEEVDGTYKPMKESMKINYVYEFFLRMVYNDLKFFSIPRIGYDHRINKTVDNITYFSSKLPLDTVGKDPKNGGLTQPEYKFWMDLAKKEYFFDNDRKKAYQPA